SNAPACPAPAGAAVPPAAQAGDTSQLAQRFPGRGGLPPARGTPVHNLPVQQSAFAEKDRGFALAVHRLLAAQPPMQRHQVVHRSTAYPRRTPARLASPCPPLSQHSSAHYVDLPLADPTDAAACH